MRGTELIADGDVKWVDEQHGWAVGGVIYADPERVFSVVDVPESVDARQIRQALTQMGLRQSVEDYVAAGSADLQDWWHYHPTFERHHPLVLEAAQSIGVTGDQLDQLWILAATL